MLLWVLFSFTALFWVQLFGMRTEEGLTAAALTVCLGTFACGLAGSVSWIYKVMLVLSGLGAAAFIFNVRLVGEKRSFIVRLRSFFSPGYVLLLVLFLYAVPAFRNALYTYPDEYFQWGTAVRDMVKHDLLPSGEWFTGSALTFSTATMFQYYWSGIGRFTESNSMVGNFLFTFIPVFLPLACGDEGWKKWKRAVAYAVIIFLSINALTYIKYYSLLQDLVLPFWAAGLITWLLWKKEGIRYPGMVLASVCVIGAMKNFVGLIFGGMAVFVFLIRWWSIYGSDIKKRRSIHAGWLLYTVGLCASLFLIEAVWSRIANVSVYGRISGNSVAQKNIQDIVKGVINKAFIAPAGSAALPFVSYIEFAVLCIVAVAVAGRFKKICESHVLLALKLYIVGFFGYFAVMLFAYIFVFGVADSSKVAGLERYFSYYMLLGVIPFSSLVLFGNWGRYEKFKAGIVVAVFLFLLTGTEYGFVTKISAINKWEDNDYRQRYTYQKYGRILRNNMDSDGRLLILGQISSDMGKMLTYELGPGFIWNRDCYKMYLRTKEDTAIYRDVMTYPDLVAEEYDYVLVWRCPEDDPSRFLFRYKIRKLKNGELYRYDPEADRLILCENILDAVKEQ